MPTEAETKLVAFLRKLQTTLDGGPLSYIKKIYSDSPRKDINSTAQFPRVQVRELGGSGRWTGMGDTAQFLTVELEVIVFVDMTTPFDHTDTKIDAFWSPARNMSPEEACSAIAYNILSEVVQNKATLLSDNSSHFIMTGDSSYNNMGIDNTYFSNLNVYKGALNLTFLMRT